MNRRDALKALASVAGTAGLTVTPVTMQDVQGVELVLIKCKGRVSDETAQRIRELWEKACEGTSVPCRAVVLEGGLEVEFVRTRAPDKTRLFHARRIPGGGK